MTTLRQALEMTRGDSQSWSFAVAGPSGPVSLASHHGVYFTAKRSVSDLDASAIFQKSLPSGIASVAGIQITNLTAGTGILSLSPSDTAALEDAIVQLSYDLQFVDVGGNKYTIVAGRLVVHPDVTLS